MSGMGLPILPETAPFPAEHIEVLNAVMAHASAEQRHWLSGFLAGYHAALTSPAALPASAPAAEPRKKIPLTVLYGTNSGNAEGVADAAKKAAAKSGFAARLVDMADTEPAEMAKAEHLLVITSTWGEGDPPERAAEFYAALMADDAPRFDGVPFSVLALGDTSYVNFCETGRQIDARLEALGGKRIAPRVDCDLDYDEPAATWTRDALKQLADLAEPEPAATRPARGEVINFPGAAAEPLHGKANPFPAEITELVNLNGSRSGKQTIHLELSLEGSGSDLRAWRFARHRDREPAGDGRGRPAGSRPRERCGPRGAACRRVGHHDALAPSARGLRRAQSSTGAGRADRRRRLARLCARPAAARPARGFSGSTLARAADRAAAQAAAPALLGGFFAQGGARRGASPGRRGALREPRPRAPRRRLDLRGRAAAHGRCPEGLRQAQQELPAARGPRPAADHDRPGHRRGAVPGVPAGSPGRPAPRAATGCSSAIATTPTTSSTSSSGRICTRTAC